MGEQVGASQDMLTVFRGRQDLDNQSVDPLGGAPVWRYMAKDALHSPDVPAVDQFRKAMEEADKQAQKRTKQSP